MKTAIVIVLCTLVTVYGQIPVPNKPLGYTYGTGNTSAPIQLSIYLGPLCPDSQNAFPTMLKVADYYGPDTLRLITHQFPLPYHRNSFLAAKGSHIVDKMTSGNRTYNWLQLVYSNLDKLSNDATHQMSEQQVQSLLASLGVSLGINAGTFVSTFKDEMIEEETRLDWKYTATRGIAWTPAFMINDVLIQAEPTWTLKEWNQVIDQLLGRVQAEKSPSAPCAFGTKKCEYLPGKIECCKHGEACIPNVGCRC